jgi:streptogramin lyase
MRGVVRGVTYSIVAIILALMFDLGAQAATVVPGDFVVVDLGATSSITLIRRFNTSGAPDPAPGQSGATFFAPVPFSAAEPAWGPDGNLYTLFPGRRIVGFDVDTNTQTTFTTDANAIGAHAIAFGPDGNLYTVVNSAVPIAATIFRYCGPLNGAVCTPGNLFPAGVSFATVPNFQANSIVFGPDENLYVSGKLTAGTFGTVVLRFCGPINGNCNMGSPLGVAGGPAGDPTFVALPVIPATPGAVSDLAFGPDRNLYVGFEPVGGAGQVLRYCGTSSVDNCIEGTPLPAPGQSGAVFVKTGGMPQGLDFGPDGNLYLTTDQFGTLPRSVLKFLGPNCSPAPCEGQSGAGPGGLLVATGTGGLSFPGILRFPHSSAPPAGVLFVSSPTADVILRYDAANGASLPASAYAATGSADFVNLDTLPGGSRGSPTGLAVGPDGNLYVGTSFNAWLSVLRFDMSGAPVPSMGLTGADFAENLRGYSAGFAFGPQDLFVADTRFGSVDKVEPLSNPGSVTFTKLTMQMPQGIAFGPDGDLYVADIAGRSLLRFDGQSGDFKMFLRQNDPNFIPYGVAFGPDGNLYVSNQFGGAVERFDVRTGNGLGTFVANWGIPSGLAFGPDLNLYVVNQASVSRFDGSSGLPLPSPGNLGADFVAPQGGFLPTFLAFSGGQTNTISGGVFEAVTGNPLPNVQVQVAQLVGGVLPGCPALGFLQCPSTLTDARGQYAFGALAAGTFLVTAWPPSGTNLFPNTIVVTIPTGSAPPQTNQNIFLTPPAPIPNGITVTPSNPVQVPGGNVPVARWDQPLTLQITACVFGTVSYTLALIPNPPSPPVAMSPVSFASPIYTATIGPFKPFKGSITVTTSVTCPGGGGPQVSSFLLYIDPSGTVVDDVTGRSIPGATVTLLRSTTPKGVFTEVPAGSALMSPSNRTDPFLTQADGAYGWDVAPGFYKLQASAPGYTCNTASSSQGFTCIGNTVESNSFAIPPAVLDLNLPLHALTRSIPTSLTYTGDTQGDFNDPATLAATLKDTSQTPAAPVSGALLTLNLGALSCTATTDATGRGTCSVTPNQTAGSYPLSASFAGTSQYLASNASANFTVVAEETTLAITSSPTLAGGSVVATARLLEDGSTPISGRTVTFTAGGMTAAATTDATGVAKVTLALVSGQYPLSAGFAGDANYKPSNAPAQTLIVFQPTQFVIWGGNPPIPSGQIANVAIGQDYMFWGAQWQKQVLGGNFQANAGFKGYADTVSAGGWTATPDKSSGPPRIVEKYIGVIVSTSVTRGGGATSGNVAEMVVLRVDSPDAYSPNPGHSGTGILVAVVH